MAETKQAGSRLIIKETVDGRPAAEGAARGGGRRGKGGPALPNGKADPYLWGMYLLLLAISVVELFSASSTEVTSANVYGPLIRHCVFLAMGFGIVVAFQNIHYSVFKRCALFFAVLSLGLLLVSNYIGVEINGAQRAINVLGFTIQPAEIVKLTVVVLLAAVLAKYQMPGGVTNRGVWYAGLVVMVFSACLLRNGLTNMILLMGSSLAMFLIGGMQLRKIVAVLIVYAVGGGAMYLVKSARDAENDFDRVQKTAMAAAAGGDEVLVQQISRSSDGRGDTRRNRIKRFIEGVHPQDTIDDLNRQVVFANFAQANGGMFGKGPGNSRESARLPLAFSDYIYSIVVEETGFVGGMILLILYLCIVARAGRIASKCSRAFPALLIMGCAVLIVFQAIVHMCIVTGVFPVSGQPLPFISKGGTSVLVMSAAVGMMLSVSRFAVTNGNKEQIRAEMKDLPEDIQAANPTQLNPR